MMKDPNNDAPHLISTVRGLMESEAVKCYEYPRKEYLGVQVIQQVDPELADHAWGHDHCPGCAGGVREAHVLMSDYSLDLLIGYLQDARNRMDRMTPYVQREIFRAFDQTIYAKVSRAVSHVGSHWGNELRCHELARAVHGYFNDLQLRTLRVVDGKLGAIEHSWLELVVPIAQTERGRGDYPNEPSRLVIIDVYTPGRLPQVQMIHKSPLVERSYREETPRTDINEGIVADVLAEIKEGVGRK